MGKLFITVKDFKMFCGGQGATPPEADKKIEILLC